MTVQALTVESSSARVLAARARKARPRPAPAERRFQALADVSRRLAVGTRLDEAVAYAVRRTREACGAEGCAILVADRKRAEFRFTVASQSTSHLAPSWWLAEIRFPVNEGIAGWVLSHDEAVLVPSTTADGRFYPGVDQRTNGSTRAVICAPLRTATGVVGVIEVVNPMRGGFDAGDLQLVEAVAALMGMARDGAPLRDAPHADGDATARLVRWSGVALAVVGAVLAATVVFCQVAQAIPLGEFWGRPGAAPALATIVAGGLLGLLKPAQSLRRGS